MAEIEEKKEQLNDIVDKVAKALQTLRRQPQKDIYVQLMAIDIVFLNMVTVQKLLDVFKSIGLMSRGLELSDLNPGYSIVWGCSIAILFVLAVGRRMKSVSTEVESPSANSPIRGLTSFTSNDIQIFKNLERNTEIQRYRDAIINNDFKIGILMAGSGSGKTSLLHAGLSPELNLVPNTLSVIVTFSADPPLVTIHESLQEQLRTEEIGKQSTLKELLNQLAIIRSRGDLILIFDQFEQFFTQNPTEESRSEFLMQLLQVYKQMKEVKILLSIRSDFSGHLYEVQSLLGYQLNADKNYFELKKFYPSQVVKIFRYVASTEKISDENIDLDFIKRIAENDLSESDGKISAANIQILLWVLKSKKAEGKVAFTEVGFKDLGGLDGLLKGFITDHLNTPNPFNKDNDILYCLLALIDPNTSLRSGRLTTNEIISRLPPGMDTQNVQAILDWLETLRLVTKLSARNSVAKYELAHERLVEPIRQIESVNDIDSRKATELLERRTNEWVNNLRKGRFLLSFSDLWFIRKNLKLISYGKNEEVKRDYLERSFTKFKKIAYGTIGVIILLGLWTFITTTTYYRIEVKTLSHIKGKLDDNKKSLTPNFTILDSLSTVDEEYVGKYCLNSGDNSMILQYIRLKVRNDSKGKDLKRLWPFVDSLDVARTSGLIEIARKITDNERLQDSLFIVCANELVSSPTYIENLGGRIDRYLDDEESSLSDLISELIKLKKDSALGIITGKIARLENEKRFNATINLFIRARRIDSTYAEKYINEARQFKNTNSFTVNDVDQLLLLVEFQSLPEKRRIYEEAKNLVLNASRFDQDEDTQNTNLEMIFQNILSEKNTQLDPLLVSIFSKLTLFDYRDNCVSQLAANLAFNNKSPRTSLVKGVLDQINKYPLDEQYQLYFSLWRGAKLIDINTRTLVMDKMNALANKRGLAPSARETLLELMKETEIGISPNMFAQYTRAFEATRVPGDGKGAVSFYGSYIIPQMTGVPKKEISALHSKIICHLYAHETETYKVAKVAEELVRPLRINRFEFQEEEATLTLDQLDSLIQHPALEKYHATVVELIWQRLKSYPHSEVSKYLEVLQAAARNVTNSLHQRHSTIAQREAGLIVYLYSSMEMFDDAYDVIYSLKQSTNHPNHYLTENETCVLLLEINMLKKYKKRKDGWGQLI